MNNILDEMNRGSRFRKYVLIIIIAPTRSNNISNDIDREYVEDQLQTIPKFWIPILKTESIPKPESVILFANKSDLFSDPSCLDRVFGDCLLYTSQRSDRLPQKRKSVPFSKVFCPY